MSDWNDAEADVDAADWGAAPDNDEASVDMDIDPSAFPDADDSKWDDAGDTDPAAAGWDDDKMDEPSKPPALSKQDSYFVMNVDTLEKRAHRLVKQTAEMLFVTEEEASCLLRHYGWKSQQLQTDWFNDSDKVRKTVGVSARRVITLPAVVPCQAAFCEEVASDKGTALNCGHFFCDDCWQGYLVSNVTSGRTCIFTRCMGIKCSKPGCTHKFGCTCDEMVPDHMFSKYLSADLLAKYKRWVLASFVEGEKKVKWCPNPKCSHTVEYVPGGPKPVHCVCGYYFCFACLQQAHVPAPCDLVKKWLEREQSDDATAVWLAARTKACPKCEVRIEKNKACNHMKCIKCGHDFCWLCKGEWKEHGSGTGGYYQCNKYDDAVSKGSLTSEEKTIQDNQKLLQKYRFYYNRFKGSQESIALTMKLGEKLDKLVENDASKSNYISDAISKLIEARRVLQWTYSMAYYLKAGKEKSLFEYQQELLIHQTEMLQELMDNTDPEMLPARRKEIIDRTGTMENFRRQMVAEVESGKFEVLLLNSADTVTNMWGCTACKCDNKPDQEFCMGCTACRTHGEQECKACRKKAK